MSRLAGKALLKMIKRWPSMISKCVLTLTENIRNPNSPEYAVLGSCAVLATQTVLKHLTMVIILIKSTLHSFQKVIFSDISFINTLSGPKGILIFSPWDSFKVTLFSDISQYLNWFEHFNDNICIYLIGSFCLFNDKIISYGLLFCLPYFHLKLSS